MEIECSLTLPDAHQQIRLADLQVSAQKWSAAINYYSRAIDYFKAIKNTLNDAHLISIIRAQIDQCEKTIHLCRLKDRAEQAVKAQQAERTSRMTRAHSTSSFPEPNKSNTNRHLSRHNTMRLENTFVLGGQDGTDSLAALIFPKKDSSKSNSPLPMAQIAKKKAKPQAHQIEELQMSNEALKEHLKMAYENIERLQHENQGLKTQRRNHSDSQPQFDLRFLIASHEEEDEENELEATL